MVRRTEIERSTTWVRHQLNSLPSGPVRILCARPGAGRLAVSQAEGWRGEVVHVAITGDDGRFVKYKVVDPSFHNWPALSFAVRENVISDFPLCNKSFNLSYSGADL